MKRIALIFLFTLLYGLNCEAQYSIKGHVQNRVDGTVRLFQFGESSLDSKECKVTNGKFNFEGSLKYPEHFGIEFTESGVKNKTVFESFKIFVEPSVPVEIVIYPDSISNSVITGAGLALEYHKLNQVYNASIKKIKEEYNRALQNHDEYLIKSIKNKGGSLKNENINQQLEYIEKHPKSFLSAYLLYSFYQMVSKDTVKKYYSILDRSLQVSNYNKTVMNYLATLPGNHFQDFELYDANHNLQLLSKIAKNKVVLVDFWFAGCIPCRKQHPIMSNIYEKYQSRGFEIVGVSSDRDTATFRKTIKDDKMTWVNLIDRNDESSVYRVIYAPSSLPSNILIDRKGIIVQKDIKLQDLESILDKLLKE